MNDSHQDTLPSSIALFCRLVSTFDLSALSDIDLADLNALSAGGIEGLCHGLLFISDSLEQEVIYPPESVRQLSAFLNASAHLIPALAMLGDKALIQLGEMH